MGTSPNSSSRVSRRGTSSQYILLFPHVRSLTLPTRYRINGRTHTEVAKTSPFALLQQAAGEFAVTSIAHQQQKCKAAVTDLRYRVHALPSAEVGHGGMYYDDIREGEQAEIVFTFIGEPPFTFTYQRAELGRGGKPGRVLETHTASKIMNYEFRTTSNQEGTWRLS